MVAQDVAPFIRRAHCMDVPIVVVEIPKDVEPFIKRAHRMDDWMSVNAFGPKANVLEHLPIVVVDCQHIRRNS